MLLGKDSGLKASGNKRLLILRSVVGRYLRLSELFLKKFGPILKKFGPILDKAERTQYRERLEYANIYR